MTHPLVRQSRLEGERREAEEAARTADRSSSMCVRCGVREQDERYDILVCAACIKELFGGDGK